MEHTCNKCEACNKASFEQLMACDACQAELDDKIEELDGSKTSNRTASKFPVHHELPRVWRIMDPGPKHGRFANKRQANTGNVGKDS